LEKKLLKAPGAGHFDRSGKADKREDMKRCRGRGQKSNVEEKGSSRTVGERRKRMKKEGG